MNRTKNLVLVSLFAALIAVGAFIRIPVPVVPFTLQFLFTTLAGTLLGARLGALSVLSYLALGLFGLPIFAGGGGPAYILQPTFGYLIGFAVGAFVTGALTSLSPDRSVKRLFVANLAGLLMVYAFGLLYCWCIYTVYIGTGIGLWVLFLHGFLLTFPSDLALCAVAAILGKRLIPLVTKGATAR
ncbi:biotin transporter BioY [Oscillibacter sp.]|uniref:biotin transporter BioY n=1 Tax=Oscillibacter sp. TaxID=1945593 RepID=UPI00345C4811